jgi:hypothetical protein
MERKESQKMMDEIMRDPERVDESGESRTNDQKALDDVTLDPRASVEQSGDIHQAEDVQESFTRVVGNAEEVPNLEPPPVENIAEEEETVKSMGDIPSKDPAYRKAGGPQSGMSEIAKIEVPNLEPPPIVNIAEEEGTIKSMGDTSTKDPAYLKAGGHQSGMSEIAKIDSFTDDPDKSTRRMTEEHQRENHETLPGDSVPPEENGER